ncbi:hypothetical protein, partial [Nocardioides sp. J9]|uniref:hypothetical protein n=1 Tax=Nocardioides sp. J9 TaxID=935844 RepID=UPI001C9463DD
GLRGGLWWAQSGASGPLVSRLGAGALRLDRRRTVDWADDVLAPWDRDTNTVTIRAMICP